MRWVLLLLVAAGCGDNKGARPRDDAGTVVIDAPSTRLTGCLDSPGLPPAPNGQLPCDLIPPGLTP